jgi:hypothetical protein
LPRDGTVILCSSQALVILCERRGRRGRYRVEKLLAEHGDVKLTELLATLAGCPKARSVDRAAARHFRSAPFLSSRARSCVQHRV